MSCPNRVGESRDDLHLFARAFPDAITIGEVGSRQSGHDRLFCRILNPQAQVTSSLVQIQGAGLKHSLVFAAVEIAEGYEIVHQLVQIA